MSDTIAAIATTPGESSVNIIRISGQDSLLIANKIFNKDISNMQSHTIKYGFIMNDIEKIDEVLLSYFKGPKSFTTEDIVEINTHGGISSVNKILELVISNGARLAEPGEFLKRAFLNGRIDLIEAESVADMIEAKNEYARKMAMMGIDKELTAKITKIKEKILSLIANIEVNIDYPEYEDAVVVTKEMIEDLILTIKKELKDLISDSEKGKIIKNGINVLIVGKPNVGKSSLLNAIIGEEKAIVTDIEGTTRDIVEGKISINGIDINFLDTAGIRETDNFIEKIGVKKSLDKINGADLILFVIDSASNFSEEDNIILEAIKSKKVIVIYNKIDKKEISVEKLKEYPFVNISALEKKNIDSVKFVISKVFDLDELSKCDFSYISNARQIGLLKICEQIIYEIEKAIADNVTVDLIEIDIKRLWEEMGKITGEVNDGDLLDEIFSKFCLGK